MAALLFLSGCATDFPILHPHVIDVKNGKCGEYQQVKTDPMTFKFLGWKDISACSGFVAFPQEDIAHIRAWYDVNKDKYKNCQ